MMTTQLSGSRAWAGTGEIRHVPLARVCDIIMGQAPAGDTYNTLGNGIALIAGAGDFSGGILAPKKFTEKPTKLSEPGDIVLSIRASIGDKVWADQTYCLGRGVAALRAKPCIDPKYLWHWVSASKRTLMGKAKGATFLQVNRTDIGELPIAVPPLDEQRRIAAILDSVDGLRTKRRQALAELDTLAHAIFHGMFGDPVNNTKGWPQQKLATLGRISTGNTPSRAVPENFGNHLEWVKTDNVNTPQVLVTPAKEGLSEQGARKARIVQPGSVLITCIAGSPGVIGNVALTDRTVAFNQQINAFTPNAGPHLYWYALLKSMKPLVQKASSGGMKGLVSKSALSAIDAIVVPGSFQMEFAERLTAIERLKDRHCAQLADLNALFASLQHRAFTGGRDE
ncbi:restriction endonuclease subunit S [Arthrobacter sp. CC3]|uniref:restriction endonuclease subunit S n=1 Tax=Arthrobacter sp. CC3 TaxID=3029185 RepID=UPI003266D86E